MTVEIYGRDGCDACARIKDRLTSLGVGYREHKIDQDVTREHVMELFPGVSTLPVLTVGGNVYMGPQQCNEALNQFGADVGKDLLTE